MISRTGARHPWATCTRLFPDDVILQLNQLRNFRVGLAQIISHYLAMVHAEDGGGFGAADHIVRKVAGPRTLGYLNTYAFAALPDEIYLR